MDLLDTLGETLCVDTGEDLPELIFRVFREIGFFQVGSGRKIGFINLRC
jgi:hypothetical protein